jgi:hypothetical protein
LGVLGIFVGVAVSAVVIEPAHAQAAPAPAPDATSSSSSSSSTNGAPPAERALTRTSLPLGTFGVEERKAN